MRVTPVDGDIGENLIALLAVLKPHQRMQVPWHANASFRPALLKFRETTLGRAENQWTRRIRDEMFVHGWNMKIAGLVRRAAVRRHVNGCIGDYTPATGRCAAQSTLGARPEGLKVDTVQVHLADTLAAEKEGV